MVWISLRPSKIIFAKAWFDYKLGLPGHSVETFTQSNMAEDCESWMHEIGMHEIIAMRVSLNCHDVTRAREQACS